MKILFLFNSFVGNGGNLSGGDVRLIKFFEFLNSKNIKFDVILNYDAYNLLLKNNIKTDRIILSPKFFDIFPFFLSYIFRTIFVIFYFLFHIDYLKNIDLFYAPSDFFTDVVPIYLFKNRKQRWIQLIHHIYPDWRQRQGNKVLNFFGYYLQIFSFKLIKFKASVIFTVNSLVKDELVKFGFCSNNIVVSSNGVDVNYFLNILPSKEVYDCVFLARLKPSKGIFDLIEIWKNVVKVNNKLRLAIIGGGDDDIKKDLLEKIEKYGLKENVFLLGYLDNNLAYSVLKSSTLFLFPSHEEGWGMIIAEAMASGVPVVAWNLKVYDYIFEDFIIKIKENNIDEFSSMVVNLLCNNDITRRISDNGLNFIKKYDWNNIFVNELAYFTVA
ncbi:MAG TPA: glycosyltransferase family 4 protein [Candidatus Pacearchaeota archaeon]|nr:glycosyltransferase family 4 protein [Candidatus Pacearchaeota archaeon]